MAESNINRQVQALGATLVDVSLPRSMNLRVEDGSGNVTINSLGGSLDLNDGSGDAMLDEIAGPVEIVDGSGDLRLANVKGAVEMTRKELDDLAEEGYLLRGMVYRQMGRRTEAIADLERAAPPQAPRTGGRR